MLSVIACPACSGQLRLPDDFLGQQVSCPKCSHVFTAAAVPVTVPAAPSASAESVPFHESAPPPLVPSVDSANGRDFESRAKPRGLVGAVELKLAPDEAETPRRAPEPSRSSSSPFDRRRRDEDDEEMLPCPGCGKRNHPDARHCYYCDIRLDDRGYDRSAERFRNPEPERRDRQPHRGVMVLLLGIFSLLCLAIPLPLAPLGVILGLIAWLMGHGDLNRMKAQEIDPDGGLTKGGWICGIIGTLLNTLMTLSCLGFFSYVLVDDYSRPPATYNQQPQFRPAPPNGGMKQPNPPIVVPPPQPKNGVPPPNNPPPGPPG